MARGAAGGLAVLNQDRPDGIGREHEQDPRIADRRRDEVTAVGLTLSILRIAPQPERRTCDGLLTCRAESLLGRRIVVPRDLFAVEGRLQKIVERSGEKHGPEDEHLLLDGDRGLDATALEETPHLGHQLFAGPGDRLLVGHKGIEPLGPELRAGAGSRSDPLQESGLELLLRAHSRQITDQKRGFQTQETVELLEEPRGESRRRRIGHSRCSITTGSSGRRCLVVVIERRPTASGSAGSRTRDGNDPDGLRRPSSF
jgi:hypothetical protein